MGVEWGEKGVGEGLYKLPHHPRHFTFSVTKNNMHDCNILYNWNEHDKNYLLPDH